jgi:hypothetical protein
MTTKLWSRIDQYRNVSQMEKPNIGYPDTSFPGYALFQVVVNFCQQLSIDKMRFGFSAMASRRASINSFCQPGILASEASISANLLFNFPILLLAPVRQQFLLFV